MSKQLINHKLNLSHFSSSGTFFSTVFAGWFKDMTTTSLLALPLTSTCGQNMFFKGFSHYGCGAPLNRLVSPWTPFLHTHLHLGCSMKTSGVCGLHVHCSKLSSDSLCWHHVHKTRGWFYIKMRTVCGQAVDQLTLFTHIRVWSLQK